MPKTSSNNNQKRRSSVRRGTNSNRPPQIRSNIELKHTYRYVSTSNTLTALTPTSILLACGGACVDNAHSVDSMFGSVKINRISIWSPPAAQGSSVTCSVNWSGYNNSPDREVSDTSVSVSTPAKVVTMPPNNSLARFWQSAGTNTVCALVAPTGSIIDVSVALILYDEDGPSDASVVTANAVQGNFYYLSLDPNATHRYTPISLTTTI